MKRIGIIYWANGDGVATSNTCIIKHLGYEPVEILFDQKLPESLDAILLYGPWGSMQPLANQLNSFSPDKRPKFIWWLTEQLPNPALPEWIRYWGGYIRSQMERMAYFEDRPGKWKVRGWFGKILTAKALRFRYYGDLFWMRKQGILTMLVQGSPTTNAFLRERGFQVYTPPSPSYYPEWGTDLGLERDIPVLWIGKVGTRRRRRLLAQVEKGLSKHGLELLRIDGEKNPYVFGDERTKLINRTKVVLNLLRAEWDNNAMRIHIAALNRAMIISEPMLNHTPYRPGVHLIEAKVADIPPLIYYYVNNEEERRAIADKAYELVISNKREDVIAEILAEVFKS
jgi:hypothetical protein